MPYFRSYDLRHTCATLLLYDGRTLNEVAEHLGHADPGFTARTYAHVMRDASRRRRITISEAIRTGRAAARRRPLVDPAGAERDREIAKAGRRASPERIAKAYHDGELAEIVCAAADRLATYDSTGEHVDVDDVAIATGLPPDFVEKVIRTKWRLANKVVFEEAETDGSGATRGVPASAAGNLSVVRGRASPAR